jgi:hypothetical protein
VENSEATWKKATKCNKISYNRVVENIVVYNKVVENTVVYIQ